MHLPRIRLSHDISPRRVFLIGPALGTLLGAALLLPILLLLPRPSLASAQTPPATPAPWCGDGTCNGDYGEAPYNCSDCLTTCEGANWCTDGVGASPSGCPDYTPYDHWAYVPHVSYCGGLGCCLSVAGDDNPPVTTAILDGTHGLDDWFVSPVTVTLVVSDDWSGVYSTNLDGTPYSGPRLYDTEGATTIAYQSYDNARNLEDLKSTTFSIDSVPPATYVASPSPNSWVGGVVTIAGMSVDETSGLAGVDVSFDGGATWLPATGGEVWSYPWDTRVLGVNVIQVRGRDQAGNNETPIVLAVNIDNSGPFFDVGPFPAEHCFACSGPITFSLTAFDEQSGIANSAVVVKQNGQDVRVLQAPAGELRGAPVVWDGRDSQGNPVPVGDYQLLFYTANRAALFGSYSAGFRVTDTAPAGAVVPAAAPLAPASPPENTPWTITPNPSQPTLSAPMVAAIERMTGGRTQQDSRPQAGNAALAALSKLAGAQAGQSAASTGAGAGVLSLLALAAAYIAGQQATGNLDLGRKLSELSAAWKPAAKPAAPPVPRVAPPGAPPPPPPRPRMLRWDEIPQAPPPPPPKPVYYYAPPKPKVVKPTLSAEMFRFAYVEKARLIRNARQPARSTSSPPYANPWPAVPLDTRALARTQERLNRQKSLEQSNLNWLQKMAVNALGEGMLALDAFDQYVGTGVKETANAIGQAGQSVIDYAKERDRKRDEQRKELDKTSLPPWKKALVVGLTDINTSLGDFDQAIGQHVRPGLTRAADHAAQDMSKVLGWAPLAPGETRAEVALRAVTVNNADILTLGLFRTDTGKQMAVDMLLGAKEAVDYTGHHGRMAAGMEQLDPGMTRGQALAEAFYGASTIMSLGGTSDIREGIEEGDPLKVALGTLQTVTIFAGIGALGSTAKTAGLKAVGAIDDIAYKQAMAAIKTVMTAGEAADAVSGGVMALQGAATGNPVGVIAGLASIGTVDVPGKVTREIAEELVEEGLEKVVRETVEEVTEEGIGRVVREAVEEVTEEVVEKTAKEAVEDIAEETTEVVGKQVDEAIDKVVGQGRPDNSLDSLNIQSVPQSDTNMLAVELVPRLEAANNTIESVCDLDNLPKIDVKAEELLPDSGSIVTTIEGRYTPARGPDRPALIQINPKGSTPELSLAHETGHYIDDFAFGIVDPVSGNRLLGSQAALKKLLSPDLQNAYDGLFEAFKKSITYSNLKDALYLATKNNYPEAIYIENLLQREEMFARGYAQYIATQSGNEVLVEQVLTKAEPILNQVHRAWPSEDFGMINEAFDDLFRVAGMRK